MNVHSNGELNLTSLNKENILHTPKSEIIIELYNKTRYTNKELLEMNAVEVYKLVLSGRIKRFPNGFWKLPDAYENAANCIRFLLEEVLNWDEEIIKKEYTYELLGEYRLYGMLNALFDDSPYAAFENAYSGRLKPWEFAVTKNGILSKEMARDSVKWLLEEKLKWSDEEILQNFSNKILLQYGLYGMINNLYKCSIFALLEDVYPGRFKPWELVHVPNGYWTKETGDEALRWVIETKLKMTDDDIRKKFTFNFLKEHNLSGMCMRLYKKRPYDALNSLYPDKFKPFELNQVPKNYWNRETAEDALQWFVSNKLNSNKELIDSVTKTELMKHGLSAGCMKYFDNNLDDIKSYMHSLV